MTNRRLGLAMVGCGRFGRILSDAAAELDEFEVTCAVDADPAAAAALASAWGAQATTSYDEALNCRAVAAVVLATDHASHCEMAVAAAEAGKHVFCEKPMAISFEECQRMITAASRARVTLVVGHLYRLLPLVRHVRGLIDSGSIGSPLAIHSVRSSHVVRSGWWARRSLYGGLLHSPGIHNLDLMNHFLGRPESVFALSPPPVQPGLEYSDSMFVTVSYGNSRAGSLYASMSDPLGLPDGSDTFRILCDRGAISLDFIPPGRLVTFAEGAEEVLVGPPGDHLRAGANRAIQAELQNFAAAIRGTAAPFIDPQEAAAVAVCEAAYESAARGIPVSVRRPPPRDADGARAAAPPVL